jgi:membrane fusion protein (multidrug efflux system)
MMENKDQSKTFNRSKAFKIFFASIAILLVLSFVYWLIFLNHYQSTDNAYVAAPQIQITSQVEGTLASVEVAETQAVKSGDLLFKIDSTEAKIASQMADADLLRAYRSSRSTILLAKQRKAEFDRLRSELSRRQSLKGIAAVSSEELESVRTQFDAASAAYKQALENADGLTDSSEAVNHPDVLKASAASKQAYVAFIRANVLSPVNAVIAKRNAQVGQRVAPGTPLATLVMNDDVWVDANFKEDQLKYMRVGQPVELSADIYGGKVTYAGKVVGFSPATGSNLSLLPAQNATGNWVKVVQRLPVRIALNPEELKKNPLQMGLSMSVVVDTEKQDGPSLQSMDSNKAISTNIYEKQQLEADKHVEELLAKSSKR